METASLLRYVLRRLILTAPVLVGVITIAFAVTKLVPGDPLAGMLPENPTPEQHQRVAREFGLDQPLAVQWARYVTRMARGDLGRSLRTRNPVASDLAPAFAATLELTLASFVITVALGLWLGTVAAVRRDSGTDHTLTVLSLGGVAAPVFWTALMAQVFFYGYLRWLPVGGRIDEFLVAAEPLAHRTGLLVIDAALSGSWPALRSVLWHLVLPAAVLAYRALGLVVRMTRSAMLEVLQAHYIRTARALGLPERDVVVRWGLRSALPPILTVLGLTFGQLLQGSILVETVFNWPGLGLYTVQSIINLDYPGVIAASTVITTIYVLTNLVVDLLYPLTDPRIRYQ